MARVAVIGAGWSGLAAAIEATRRGHSVTLIEMAKQCGGRARTVTIDGVRLDNGQHILIGAYVETLRLMQLVGVDIDAALWRTPLQLRNASGAGLQLPAGSSLVGFVTGVMRNSAWTWFEKLRLLGEAARWRLAGFACDPSLTVHALTRRLPHAVRRGLIDPLCIAALNTPAEHASAVVFLRVVKDALFAAPGASDLLLPRVDLGRLFPDAARGWLADQGASIRLGSRVAVVARATDSWQVDGEDFDRVVLAASPNEAARLAEPHAAQWAAQARALPFEPIVTVYAQCRHARLPASMLALQSDAGVPAQFVFDRGQLGGPDGLLAFVISGASDWVDRGTKETSNATLKQANQQLGRWLQGPLVLVQVVTEKRATIRCVPLLARPSVRIADGLHAAGDFIEGPYPATLEGAVRSGLNAVRSL